MSERELARRLLGDQELARALDPPAPTRLGRYEVLGPLGSGATSDVYRARDPLLGREVALKLLLAAAPDALRRFQQEVQVLAALSHPHIVPIHDAGLEDGRPWFVMELIGGGPLDPPSLAPGALAETLEAVARALAAAHERGVVHRDLKPQNVLLDPRGPRVADFGVAKLQGGAGGPEPGALVGTLPYMAPEQLRGAEVGPPADVWALGVMFHEGLTGRLPFAGGTLEALLASALAGPAPARTVRPDVPPPLEALTLRALAPRPEDRPSAGELAAALAAWRGEARPARRRLRWAVMPLLLGALLLGAIGAAAWQASARPAAAIAEARRAIGPAAARGDRAALLERAGRLEQLLLGALRPPERHEALATLAVCRLELGQLDEARRALDEALLVPGPRAAECHLRRAWLTAQAAVLLALRGEEPWLRWEEDLAAARALGLQAPLTAWAAGLERLSRTLEALGEEDDEDEAREEDEEEEPVAGDQGADDPFLLLLRAETALLADAHEEGLGWVARARDLRPDLALPHALLALGGALEAEQGPTVLQLESALRAVELAPELGAPVLGHLLRWRMLLELEHAHPALPAPAGLARVASRLAEEPLCRASIALFLATRRGAAPPDTLDAAQQELEQGGEEGLEVETALALCELLRARALAASDPAAADEAWEDFEDRLEPLLEVAGDQREVWLLERFARD